MSERTLPYRVVLMTAGSAEEAERLAQVLVGERLAACVNIVAGIRSIYHWQGRVEDGSEQLLVAKTTADLVPSLAERVKALHSYEVPAVLAIPVVDGWPPYLAWIEGETQAPGS